MHVSNWSDEETHDPLYADDRHFFKVEQWTRDGLHVERLLYAGNSLAKAEDNLRPRHQASPRIRLTIRQRTGCCNSFQIATMVVTEQERTWQALLPVRPGRE